MARGLVHRPEDVEQQRGGVELEAAQGVHLEERGVGFEDEDAVGPLHQLGQGLADLKFENGPGGARRDVVLLHEHVPQGGARIALHLCQNQIHIDGLQLQVRFAAQAVQDFLMKSNPVTKAVGLIVPKNTRLKIRDWLAKKNMDAPDVMSAEARTVLIERLSDDIADLEQLLGWDLSDWVR